MREEGRELEGPDRSRRNRRSRAGSTGDPQQGRRRRGAGSEQGKSACVPGTGSEPRGRGRQAWCLRDRSAWAASSSLGGDIPDGWGVHVVPDMETEMGTYPRASSRGEQRQKARRRASQAVDTKHGLTDGCAAQRSERWDVWKSSWGHEPRDPRPIRRKQEREPRVRQGNTEQNQTQGAGAPRTITKGSPARLCGPGTVRSERRRQQGRGGAERWPRVLRRGSASSHPVLWREGCGAACGRPEARRRLGRWAAVDHGASQRRTQGAA